MKKRFIKLFTPILAAAMAAAVAFPLAQNAAVGGFAAEYDLKVDAADPVAVLAQLEEAKGANVRTEYRLERIAEVAYGKVYRFQQIKNGAVVTGKGLNVSTDGENNVLSVVGRYADTSATKAAVLDEAAAGRAVYERYGEGTVLSSTEAVFVTDDGRSEPAYDMVTTAEGGMRVFVSARSGEILRSAPLTAGLTVPTTQKDFNNNDVSLNVEYVEASKNYVLADYTRNIFTYNATSSGYTGATPYTSDTETFDDSMAVSVYHTAVMAYDYYTEAENIGVVLRGLDGRNDEVSGNFDRRGEVKIYLYVHDNTSGNRENAAFLYDPLNKEGKMRVGDGSANGELYNQGRAVDVIAHEYQHGVTSFAADLIYEGDSGAINEAFSDIFGMLVEGYDPSDENFWLIGEDSVPAGKTAQRSVKAPELPQASSVRNKFVCNKSGEHTTAHNCDFNGVHKNSTIISHVQYKIWEKLPEFFTRGRIGTLWYSTLNTLTAGADFGEFAEAFREAAKNLGYEQNVLDVIDECLFTSGILELDDMNMVQFYDYNGVMIKEEVVRNGGSATPPAEDPVKPSDARYDYKFRGWYSTQRHTYNDFDNITEDMTYTASFESVEHTYVVTFTDEAGNVLKTETVPYGGAATPPEAPEKEGTEEYIYEFTGWSGSYTNVTADITLKPLYKAVPRHTHTPGEWEITKEAGCEEAGSRQKKCTGCGDVLETEVIAPTGHSFGEWHVTKEPTYTDAGEEERSCPACGETEKRAVQAFGLVKKFLDEVAALDASLPAAAQFERIKRAAETWNQLSAEERLEAQEAYELLRAAVTAYNEAGEALNEEYGTAFKTAVQAVTATAVTVTALAAAWFVGKRLG